MKKNNNNYSKVLANVKEEGKNLQFASKILRDNDIIVRFAIKQDINALQYVSERIKDKESIACMAIKNNGLSLQFIYDRLRKNKDMVLKAVRVNGLALEFADDDLKDNKEIVMEAVKNNGKALYFASERLRDNYDVVDVAITHSGESIMAASKRMQEIRKLVLKATFNANYDLNLILGKYYDEEEFFLDVFKSIHKIELIKFASSRLRSNKEFALKIVSKEGTALRYFNESIKNDLEVVLQALEEDNRVIPMINKELWKQIKGNNPINNLKTLIIKQNLSEDIQQKNKSIKVKI